MLDAIRRRPWIFGSVALGVGLIWVVASALFPVRYTAIAEVVIDDKAHNPDIALSQAQGWLNSQAAVLDVSHTLRTVIVMPNAPAAARSSAAGGHEADQASFVRYHISSPRVVRIPDSYALDIGVSAADPRTAAIVANTFANRLAARSQRAGTVDPQLRVISEAPIDGPRDGPAQWQIVVAGLVLAVVVGAVAAIIGERRDGRLTSGADIQSRLALFHLGNVPLLQSVLPHAKAPADAIVDWPLSGYAEAFRSIWGSTRQASPANAQVFAFMSARPGVGTTTVAIGVARIAASGGKKVALIDCHPSANGATKIVLGDSAAKVLDEVLHGNYVLEDVLRQDPLSEAWVVPMPYNEDGSARSNQMIVFSSIVDDLRSRFDYVIIDTASHAGHKKVRDAAVIADAWVLVAQWRRTPVAAIKKALSADPQDIAKLSGVILTQVDIRRQARYGGNDASVFYQQSAAYYR